MPRDSPAQDEKGKDHESRERLLLRLHPERKQARQKYEAIRGRLVKFFECRGHSLCESLVDRTLTIVGRDLVDEKISVFAVRIAQKVAKDLTHEDFVRLLSRLHTDAAEAGIKYQSIRDRLISFFGRNNSNAADLADKTLDRLAKKLPSEEILNLSDYAIGIAKNVVREERRKPQEVSFDDNLGGRGGSAHE